jgi:hypothetical protein
MGKNDDIYWQKRKSWIYVELGKNLKNIINFAKV